MKKATIVCYMLLFACSYIRGQSISPSALNSTGGSQAIGNKVYEWSVGEMTLVHTASGNGIMVTQGLLQPYPPPAGIHSEMIPQDVVKVYPNPTKDIVNISYNLPHVSTLHYTLQDVAGKKIVDNNVMTKQGQDILTLNMQGLANGSYMLTISYQDLDKSSKRSTYKIDKIN